MASLLHEVWKHEGGMAVCLAGGDGHAMRASLGDGARLVATFEASSHGEAMSKYYAVCDLGTYKPLDASAFEPYPEEWKARQRNTLQP